MRLGAFLGGGIVRPGEVAPRAGDLAGPDVHGGGQGRAGADHHVAIGPCGGDAGGAVAVRGDVVHPQPGDATNICGDRGERGRGAAALVVVRSRFAQHAAWAGRRWGTAPGKSDPNRCAFGFEIMIAGDAPQIVFGVGVGLMAPILSMWQIDAVFSVVLNFIYETGLVGLIVVAAVAQLVVKAWKAMRFDLVFAAFGLVWLVGITVTTSYEQLLPLWMALGWLTVWPEVCKARSARLVSPAVVERKPNWKLDDRGAAGRTGGRG